MKKKIVAAGIALAGCLLAGCSDGMPDPVGISYDFNYAQVRLPDGTIVEGECETWSRANNGSDRLRVTIDGIDYVGSYNNIMLFSEKPPVLDEGGVTEK